MNTPTDTGPSSGPGTGPSSSPPGSPDSPPGRPTGPRPPMRTRDGKPLEVTTRIQLFWALLIAAILLTELPLPFRLVGGLACLVASWVAVTVLARMARARKIGLLLRRRSWPVAVGLGLSVVMLVSFSVDAVFYPIVKDREACVAGANTQVAVKQCEIETEDRMYTWAESVFGDLGPNPR